MRVFPKLFLSFTYKYTYISTYKYNIHYNSEIQKTIEFVHTIKYKNKA